MISIFTPDRWPTPRHRTCGKTPPLHIFTLMKVVDNLSDMKLRLTQQLLGIEDVDILAEVHAILDRADRGDWWDELTPEEQAGLDDAD